MESPIGRRRVMKEESSSGGRSFVFKFKDLQFHTLYTFQTDVLVGNDVFALHDCLPSLDYLFLLAIYFCFGEFGASGIVLSR